MIGLILLLSLLGAPSIAGAEDMTVVFVAGAPSGDEIRGRACGPSLIAPGDEPNPLCLGLPDNHMILYPDVLNGPKYADGNPALFRMWLLRTAKHESCHLLGEMTEAPCYAVEEPYAWQDWAQRSNAVRKNIVKGGK